jgi:ribosomal protein L24
MPTLYRSGMGHWYKFKRGDPVVIVTGSCEGRQGVVDSAVFQRTVDYPEEYSPGYHVVLDVRTVTTVRWNQVRSRQVKP